MCHKSPPKDIPSLLTKLISFSRRHSMALSAAHSTGTRHAEKHLSPLVSNHVQIHLASLLALALRVSHHYTSAFLLTSLSTSVQTLKLNKSLNNSLGLNIQSISTEKLSTFLDSNLPMLPMPMAK